MRKWIDLNQIHNKWLDFIIPFQVWWIIRFKRNSWVSARADQIIHKPKDRKIGDFITSIHHKWDDWMHPEHGRASLLIALVIVFVPQIILVFGIYQYVQPPLSLWENPKAFQATLVAAWQVLASLIGIAFVIIIFLTQYVVDRKFERRALPLFASRTWMVFAVLMGLLTILSMGINVLLFDMITNADNPGGIIPTFVMSITLYNLILFAINIFLTVRLYIITYKLLSPDSFKVEFRKYLQKLVNDGVHEELRNRIANKLVMEQSNQEGIDLSYFDNYPSKIPVVISGLSKTINEVVDINLELLHISAKNVRKTLGNQEKQVVIFLGELGRRLSIDRPHIAYVSSGFSSTQITYPLQKSVRLVPISDRHRSDLRNEFLLNRDMIASAIRNGNSNEVEDQLDNYLETLRSFLNSLDAVGLSYNFEMAQKELSIFSDWPFVSSILKQYYYLLDLAFKSDNSQIIHLFTEFPLQVMALGFQEKDHLLFRRFSNLYTAIYVRANRYLEDQELIRFVKDRCWRLLIEFDQFQIASSIEKMDQSIGDFETLTDFSIQILLVLNRLLKSSIDHQDWEQYRFCASAMRHIYKNVDGKFTSDNLKILDMQREHYQGQEISESFQQEYQRAYEIVRQKNRLENIRRVLMVGNGAWLIHLFETERLTSTDFFDNLSSVDVEFLSAELLYDVFCNHISVDKTYHLTDWTSWELEEIPESPGEPTFSALAFDTWLARYYTIRMIALMPTNKDMAPPELKPNINSKGTLDAITNQLIHLDDTPLWQDYLHINKSTYKFQKNVLLQIHQTAVEQRETIDEIELVHQPLDQEKIKSFIENVNMSWLESATLRALFVYYKKYEPRPQVDPPEDLLAYGVNTLDEKGAYVQQDRIGYPDWGGSYGRNLGRTENVLLSEELLVLGSTAIPENDPETSIRLSLAEMKSLGYTPIILCEKSLLFGTLYKSSHFLARWRLQNDLVELLNAYGLYDDTLVFTINGLSDKTLVLLDFNVFATLVQYRPTDEKDFPLHISIEEITLERAREILERNPDWALHPENKEALSEEAALRRIQQHVHVQIWERFRLENINIKAGRVLRVVDETNSTAD